MLATDAGMPIREQGISTTSVDMMSTYAAAKSGTPDGAATLLNVVSSVPDNVYQQGPRAIQGYLQQHYQQSRAYSPWAACAGGIVAAIGANAVVAAKAFKVKKAVEALGGVANAVAKIRGQINRGKKFNDAVYDVFNESGAGLGSLAAEFL